MTAWVRAGRTRRCSSFATGACVAALIVPLVALAGASRDIERSGEYQNKCSFHYGELEKDARALAADFCANLGGVQSLARFELSEDIIRVNEFSKKYSCTVRTQVTCYAAN